MVKRILDPLSNRSFFLFGARGTGKTTFVRDQFEGVIQQSYDFLDPEIEAKFALRPQVLLRELEGLDWRKGWVVIDEVQKIPKCLDLVHKVIESKKQAKFILTGSSARKLKRGSANLLAGRANVYNLYPLTALELGDKFDLQSALHWGTLPSLLEMKSDRERKAYLNSYVLTYLNEEVRAEQLVRRLDPFRAFLPVLGQVSGTVLNHKKIAEEVGVSSVTVRTYFQILEETLLGFYLPAFHQSVRKSQRMNPKFYVFDTGVKKALEESLDQVPSPRTSVYGQLFEHLVINDIVRMNAYREKGYRLSYFATKHGAEVDLILSKGRSNLAIEIKSSASIDEIEVKAFARLAKDIPGLTGAYYLSQSSEVVKIEGVQCLHWAQFLKNF